MASTGCAASATRGWNLTSESGSPVWVMTLTEWWILTHSALLVTTGDLAGLVENAEAWIRILRVVVDAGERCGECREQASEWIRYLEIVCGNARLGVPNAGTVQPAVPLEAFLDEWLATLAADPPSPGQDPCGL